MTFDELEFEVSEKSLFGLVFVQARVSFENGYGASVIRGRGTYGADKDLYELAVLHDDRLCYDSGLTDDVVGWLTPDDVSEWLKKIEALQGANRQKEN